VERVLHLLTPPPRPPLPNIFFVSPWAPPPPPPPGTYIQTLRDAPVLGFGPFFLNPRTPPPSLILPPLFFRSGYSGWRVLRGPWPDVFGYNASPSPPTPFFSPLTTPRPCCGTGTDYSSPLCPISQRFVHLGTLLCRLAPPTPLFPPRVLTSRTFFSPFHFNPSRSCRPRFPDTMKTFSPATLGLSLSPFFPPEPRRPSFALSLEGNPGHGSGAPYCPAGSLQLFLRMSVKARSQPRICFFLPFQRTGRSLPSRLTPPAFNFYLNEHGPRAGRVCALLSMEIFSHPPDFPLFFLLNNFFPFSLFPFSFDSHPGITSTSLHTILPSRSAVFSPRSFAPPPPSRFLPLPVI